MNTVKFQNDGSVQIIDAAGVPTPLYLSKDIVREIVEEYEIRYAIMDVETHLANSEVYGIYDSETNRPEYDCDKFTPSIVRDLAEEVINRKSNSENIQDNYYFIVDWVIEDFEKGEVMI